MDPGFLQALTAGFSHLHAQRLNCKHATHTTGGKLLGSAGEATLSEPARRCPRLGLLLASQGQPTHNRRLMACSWQGTKSPTMTMNKTLLFNSVGFLSDRDYMEASKFKVETNLVWQSHRDDWAVVGDSCGGGGGGGMCV